MKTEKGWTMRSTGDTKKGAIVIVVVFLIMLMCFTQETTATD